LAEKQLTAAFGRIPSGFNCGWRGGNYAIGAILGFGLISASPHTFVRTVC
jgi:hypothetical protein